MIHHVFACKSNIGDWLSALGIQRLLKPSSVKEYYCDEPFIESTLERLQLASSKDLIVIGGGGLFMDYFRPFWQGLRRQPPPAPLVAWGVGFCDLKSQASRVEDQLLQSVLAGFRACVVRDQLTFERLGQAATGIVPCPSISYLTVTGGSDAAILHVAHFDAVGSRIYEGTAAAVRSFADEKGLSYSEIDNQIADGDCHALERQLQSYRRARIVVSSRLHGCIIGLALGKRVIAVSGDWKVESFMNAAGLGDWVCPGDEVQRLASYLSRIEDQASPRKFLEAVCAGNKAVAARVHDLASELEQSR